MLQISIDSGLLSLYHFNAHPDLHDASASGYLGKDMLPLLSAILTLRGMDISWKFDSRCSHNESISETFFADNGQIQCWGISL
jgi:hypothetical protein